MCVDRKMKLPGAKRHFVVCASPDPSLPSIQLQASMVDAPPARDTQPHRGRLHGLLDAVGLAPRATVDAEPRNVSTPHKEHTVITRSIQDQWLSHKHTPAPMRMSLTIKTIRIGHSQGFALCLQRRESEQFLMVTGEFEVY